MKKLPMTARFKKQTRKQEQAAQAERIKEVDALFEMRVNAAAPAALRMFTGQKEDAHQRKYLRYLNDRYKQLTANMKEGPPADAHAVPLYELRASAFLAGPPFALSTAGFLGSRPKSTEWLYYQQAESQLLDFGPEPGTWAGTWDKYPKTNDAFGAGLMGFAGISYEPAPAGPLDQNTVRPFIEARQMLETSFASGDAGTTTVDVDVQESTFPIFDIPSVGYGLFQLRATLRVEEDLIGGGVVLNQVMLEEQWHAGPFHTQTTNNAGSSHVLSCTFDRKAGMNYRVKVFMECSIRVWNAYFRTGSHVKVYVHPARVTKF
jgi:hypothetical protein